MASTDAAGNVYIGSHNAQAVSSDAAGYVYSQALSSDAAGNVYESYSSRMRRAVEDVRSSDALENWWGEDGEIAMAILLEEAGGSRFDLTVGDSPLDADGDDMLEGVLGGPVDAAGNVLNGDAGEVSSHAAGNVYIAGNVEVSSFAAGNLYITGTPGAHQGDSEARSSDAAGNVYIAAAAPKNAYSRKVSDKVTHRVHTDLVSGAPILSEAVVDRESGGVVVAEPVGCADLAFAQQSKDGIVDEVGGSIGESEGVPVHTNLVFGAHALSLDTAGSDVSKGVKRESGFASASRGLPAAEVYDARPAEKEVSLEVQLKEVSLGAAGNVYVEPHLLSLLQRRAMWGRGADSSNLYMCGATANVYKDQLERDVVNLQAPSQAYKKADPDAAGHVYIAGEFSSDAAGVFITGPPLVIGIDVRPAETILGESAVSLDTAGNVYIATDVGDYSDAGLSLDAAGNVYDAVDAEDPSAPAVELSLDAAGNVDAAVEADDL